MTLTAVSLFAGIDGIGLALKRAGIRVVAAVEIDKAARGVIRDRFPNTRLYEDVTRVHTPDSCPDPGRQGSGERSERGGDRTTGRPDVHARQSEQPCLGDGGCPDCLPRVDSRQLVLTAGWPCQGNSVAGRRQGMDDARSGLWVHVARLLAELRPAWFLGENVPGLLSVNDGRDMATVLADLADCGMGFAWRVLDAQHFGVPQRRRRVFIVGRLGDRAAPVQILLEPESSAGDTPARRETGTRVAGTLGSRVGGSRTTDLDGHGAYTPVNALTTRAGATFDDQQTGQLVPVSALTSNMAGGGGGADDNTAQGGHLIPCLTAAMGSNVGHPGDAGKDDIIMAVTHALTAEGADASEDGTRRGTPLVGFHLTQDPISGDVIPAMGAKSTGNGVLDATAVRRLTPLECERLQGFPDGWTETSDGKLQADSARYRQLGNAVAVPVVEWVARRIVAHHQGTAI